MPKGSTSRSERVVEGRSPYLLALTLKCLTSTIVYSDLKIRRCCGQEEGCARSIGAECMQAELGRRASGSGSRAASAAPDFDFGADQDGELSTLLRVKDGCVGNACRTSRVECRREGQARLSASWCLLPQGPHNLTDSRSVAKILVSGSVILHCKLNRQRL